MKKESRVFYFVFVETNPTEKKWYHRFTCNGFRHVLVFMQCGGDVLEVDPQHYGVEFKGYYNVLADGKPVTAEEVAASYVETGYRVVRWSNENYGGHCLYNTGTIIPSCVSACKLFTGCPAGLFVFTPKRLYQWLLKNQGEDINGRPS